MQDEVRLPPLPSLSISHYPPIPFTTTNPMQEIQKATASEPLSLHEEHSMQQSWRLDHDKLTFIVCRAPSSSVNKISPEVHDSPDKMIGDVNLFIYEDEDEDEAREGREGARAVIGEVEIMIAAKAARRQGFARESLLAFLSYITSSLEDVLEEYRRGSDERSERYLRYLRVKIDQHNVASLKLFEAIGFKRIAGEPNYFGEVEMRVEVEEGKMMGVEVEDAGKKVSYGN
jgi:RimJ/RimL family protein N-acetyltransferase